MNIVVTPKLHAKIKALVVCMAVILVVSVTVTSAKSSDCSGFYEPGSRGLFSVNEEYAVSRHEIQDGELRAFVRMHSFGLDNQIISTTSTRIAMLPTRSIFSFQSHNDTCTVQFRLIRYGRTPI
jgi:low affinity Fe/Cu permease